MRTYVTFGQTHAHSVNGKTFDKDCVAVIKTEKAWEGRDKEEYWKENEQLKYFPRGYINVNF